MGECLKTVVKIVLAVLPVICIVLFSVSIVMLAVSLDPGVKWNEYKQDFYTMKEYYFNTLFESLDVAIYAGKKNNHPCDSEYLALLNPHHDESWKDPIRTTLHTALGLVSGTLFLLIVSLTIHSVTKQKLFTALTKVTALGTGIAGGYFLLEATEEYVKGMPGAISLFARSPNNPTTRAYFPEKEEMQIGYNLAKFSAIITIIGCVLELANIALYIKFGEGKWIWQKNTEVIPDPEEILPETNKIGKTVKNKTDIVTVKEFQPQ